MSKKFIEKNIKLSLEFDKYITQHPDVMVKIPRGAYVIMTVKGDEEFNQNSKELVKKSRTQKFIEARKEGMKWMFQPLVA